MHTLDIATARREEFVDITARLKALAEANNWQDGLMALHCPHTTAGLTVNENADPDVARDMLATLARLAPLAGDYRHAEGNSDAHVKASLMGCGLTVMVAGGRLQLGVWQGVYLCEFDGPRRRKVWVSFLKG